MQIERLDVRTFGQALLLSVLLYLMGVWMFTMVPGWYDRFVFLNLDAIGPSACILAGLVFLSRRVKTTRWVAFGVVFVGACIGAGFVLTALGMLITGDGL